MWDWFRALNPMNAGTFSQSVVVIPASARAFPSACRPRAAEGERRVSVTAVRAGRHETGPMSTTQNRFPSGSSSTTKSSSGSGVRTCGLAPSMTSRSTSASQASV